MLSQASYSTPGRYRWPAGPVRPDPRRYLSPRRPLAPGGAGGWPRLGPARRRQRGMRTDADRPRIRREDCPNWPMGGVLHPVKSADDPSLLMRNGLYDLVEGRVVSVGYGSRMVFLDFGRNFRTDFTVMVPKSARPAPSRCRNCGRQLEGAGSARAWRHRGQRWPGHPDRRSIRVYKSLRYNDVCRCEGAA